MNPKSSWLGLVFILLAVAALTFLSPPEATLGANARLVYLHGAWVWAALAAFIVAAAIGLVALLRRREALYRWSRAWGRAAILFWVTYLPVSLWAMQTNWNGLFLAEPRWRLAWVFSITGILLQLGLSFLPVRWSPVGNIAFLLSLFAALLSTENVMHPPSPMLDSGFGRIQFFFAALTLLLIFAAWQIARLFYGLRTKRSM